MLRIAERDERSRNDKLFDAALDYIALCERLRDDYKKQGLQAPEFDIDPNDILTDASARTVSLSTRSQNRATSTSLTLDDLKRQFTHEVDTLEVLLAANPDNRVMRRGIEFLRQMLRRLAGP